MRKVNLKIIPILLVSLGLSPIKNYGQKCIATWYNMHGRKSASGTRMDSTKPTAAYNFLPLGSEIMVTNIQNNKSIIVTITDRMGTKKRNRIDLSIKAFTLLSKRSAGRITVKIKRIK